MKTNNFLPEKPASPAGRALANAGIATLIEFSKYGQHEITGLHGVGHNVIVVIKQALLENELSFSKIIAQLK